jgi:hypothetical protein
VNGIEPKTEAQMQITAFDPTYLIEFAGGKPALLESAKSFRPGSLEWQNRLLAEISEKASGPLAAALNTALAAQIQFFGMMHGPRPAGDSYDWDGNFERQLLEFMDPFFKYAFSTAHDIDKSAQEWLSQACPAPEQLAEAPEFLAEFCRNFGAATIRGVYQIKAKPGQLLSLLGIGGADASVEGWPEPATAAAEEPVAPAPEKGKPGRKKKDRGAAGNITLGTAYLKAVSVSSSYTPKMLGASLGVTPISIKKAIEGETPGISVTPENAKVLEHELRTRSEELALIAKQLQESIVYAQMAGA